MVKSTQPVSVQVLDDSLIKRNSVTNCQSVCFRSRMAALIAAGGEGMCPQAGVDGMATGWGVWWIPLVVTTGGRVFSRVGMAVLRWTQWCRNGGWQWAQRCRDGGWRRTQRRWIADELPEPAVTSTA